MRSVILITLDSCTWLSYLLAQTPFFDTLGPAFCARSHGDSTLTGHKALLCGRLPHSVLYHGKQPIFAPITAEFFELRGYTTIGAASLPYLHPMFGFNRSFTEYKYRPEKAIEKDTPVLIVDLRENLRWITQQLQRHEPPYFIFLNIGETHYPFQNEDDGDEWKGEKMLSVDCEEGDPSAVYRRLASMARDQIRQVEWVDFELNGWILGKEQRALFKDAAWIVTADHGEMFGEDHRFSHATGSFPQEIYVPLVISEWEWLKTFGTTSLEDFQRNDRDQGESLREVRPEQDHERVPQEGSGVPSGLSGVRGQPVRRVP